MTKTRELEMNPASYVSDKVYRVVGINKTGLDKKLKKKKLEIPIEDIRISDIRSFKMHRNTLEYFVNLTTLKISNIEFKS